MKKTLKELSMDAEAAKDAYALALAVYDAVLGAHADADDEADPEADAAKAELLAARDTYKAAKAKLYLSE